VERPDLLTSGLMAVSGEDGLLKSPITRKMQSRGGPFVLPPFSCGFAAFPCAGALVSRRALVAQRNTRANQPLGENGPRAHKKSKPSHNSGASITHKPIAKTPAPALPTFVSSDASPKLSAILEADQKWSQLRENTTLAEAKQMLAGNTFEGSEDVGVRINDTGVCGIFLANKQLEGPLPDFDCFTELRDVYLNNNKLSGPVPSFCHQDKLINLVLYGNKFEGSVPAGSLPVSETFKAPINTCNPNLMLGTAEENAQQVKLLLILRSMSSVLSVHKSWARLREDMALEEVGNLALTGDISLDGSGIVSLWLHEKRLEGAMPDFSCCRSLKSLALGSNLLYGPLPTAWPSSLTTLYINKNPRFVHPNPMD
jgi:hypothetical protein